MLPFKAQPAVSLPHTCPLAHLLSLSVPQSSLQQWPPRILKKQHLPASGRQAEPPCHHPRDLSAPDLTFKKPSASCVCRGQLGTCSLQASPSPVSEDTRNALEPFCISWPPCLAFCSDAHSSGPASCAGAPVHSTTFPHQRQAIYLSDSYLPMGQSCLPFPLLG